MIIVRIFIISVCSARAVIPPPRLRAKWVFFSAILRKAELSQGGALS
jgi:hypothetical protein